MYSAKRLLVLSKLFIPIFMMGLTVMFGVIGYVTIENFSFFDALYMTMITITTVGFGEVHPLSESGRIFTLILIFVNLSLFTYFITLLSKYVMDGAFAKNYKLMKMENSIEKLKNHVIICGFGRNGKESAQVLYRNKIPFVVLEHKNDLEEIGHLHIQHFVKADATKDEVLLEAGIKHARALITTLPLDADNLFVVLTAKQLNPSIKVISRASQDSSVKKLKIAGADNVIMPDKIGGAQMASMVMLPDVAELIALLSTSSNKSLRIEELHAHNNITLKELDLWNKTNCTLLGIKNAMNEYAINPASTYLLKKGERLIVMGSDEQIEKAKEII
ncbi:MAG: potassium channel family protein [Ferruginibacter sp.]